VTVVLAERVTEAAVYRCRREGFVVSGDDSADVQMLLSQSWSFLNAMSFAIHLASGKPNT